MDLYKLRYRKGIAESEHRTAEEIVARSPFWLSTIATMRF
jgi:hypothetical protein